MARFSSKWSALALGAALVGGSLLGARGPDGLAPLRGLLGGGGRSVRTPRPKPGEALAASLERARGLDAEGLLAAHALPFGRALPYDPSAARGLELVQASTFALDGAEAGALRTRGFVVSEKKRYPTFTDGYAAIYAADLPAYVTADALLFAVHRSYDALLEQIERSALARELEAMLAEMRAALATGGGAGYGREARADVDLYLAVALRLLTGRDDVAPVAGADAGEINRLVGLARDARGSAAVRLFGLRREEDVSQFAPRGHYVTAGEEPRGEGPRLDGYFRAMAWLGRVDFRLLETLEDGSQVFRRRQLEGALALRSLLGPSPLARWRRIDEALRAFAGDADSMTVPELDRFVEGVGARDPSALASLGDEALAGAIAAGGYGDQQIAGHLMRNGRARGTLPLSRSFLPFGQRYAVDAHVFSNVVFDRVAHGHTKRMMPNALDVAYAALGNEAAAALLAPELGRYGYAPELEAVRALVDGHGPEFWGQNLYHLWLGALRSLSPRRAELADPAAAGLPAVAATEPWSRRLLTTQLASWAELRHDTLLYTKQSYTTKSSCKFPDAYVDPYPEFYAGLEAFAARGRSLAAALAGPPELGYFREQVVDYFDGLARTSSALRQMAERERAGQPLTPEHLAFVNRLVTIDPGCGDPTADGWYGRLFFGGQKALKYEPTIADVHTQPTDEVGREVGRVLHVGTGSPRALVVTVEAEGGPRAYVGLVSSYFERVTENYERLDDAAWADALKRETPPDVPWAADFVVR
jgi:hypothetical protein